MSGSVDPVMEAELPLPPESQESDMSDHETSTVENKRKNSSDNVTVKDKKYRSDSVEDTRSVSEQARSNANTGNGTPNSWEELISHHGDSLDTSMEEVSPIKHGVIIMELIGCSKKRTLSGMMLQCLTYLV